MNGDKATVITPTNFSSGTHDEWKAINNYIVNNPAKTVELNWGGTGGDVAMGAETLRAIRQAQKQGKTVTTKLVDDAGSMHALVTCYAPPVNRNDQKALIFHADAITVGGQEFRFSKDKSMIKEEMNMCVKAGILSPQMVDKIYSGYVAKVYKTHTEYEKDQRRPME